jgi:hypothetical protein
MYASLEIKRLVTTKFSAKSLKELPALEKNIVGYTTGIVVNPINNNVRSFIRTRS